jgi:hypothetical protein
MAIVGAEIYFMSGGFVDSFVVGACTETGNMRVEEIDRRGILSGLTIPEVVEVVDALEDLEGEMVPASMAIVASYVDMAYADYDRHSAEGPNADDLLRFIEMLAGTQGAR